MGLPTACLFAEAGFKVICLDVDQYIIDRVRRGVPPFDEPGLRSLMKKYVRARRLEATTSFKDAVPISDAVVIVVPVQLDRRMRPDYSPIERACRDIGLNMRRGTLIIVESTLSPGTTETLIKETLETASGLRAGVDFGLAYSPIRAMIGRTLEDIANYPRVLGAIDEASLRAAEVVLATISKGEILKVRDIKTAEAVKLFENVYRDVNIALANELSRFCEEVGIDFVEVRNSANTQPYCHLLLPGIVGGHIPKDPYLLISDAEVLGVKLRLVTASRKVNEEVLKRALRLVRDALRSCGKTARRSRILVLGVSYRPDVKEVKGSLVRDLVKMLQNKGMRVRVYDPLFSYSELVEMGYPAEKTLTKAARDVDCLLIAVGHERFRHLNLKRLKMVMRRPAAVVDLGHVLSCEEVEGEGLVYRGLGRGVWTR